MTNSLHFSEWRNCIRAQRKVNLCAPGAPKGPKVGMFVRQYEIVCANDAGRAPSNNRSLRLTFDEIGSETSRDANGDSTLSLFIYCLTITKVY